MINLIYHPRSLAFAFLFVFFFFSLSYSHNTTPETCSCPCPCPNTSNEANSNTKNDASSNTSNGANSNTKNDANSNTSNGTSSNTKNDVSSNTSNGANSNSKNDASSNTSNDTSSNTKNDASSNTSNSANSNSKNDANSNTSNSANSNNANSNTSNDANSNTKNHTNSNTSNDVNSNTKNDANSNTKNDANSNTSNDANSNTKNDANSSTLNDANSNTKNDANSNTKNDANSNTSNGANSNTKNDANSNTSNDTNSNTSNDANSNTKNDANSNTSNDANSNTKNDANSNMSNVVNSNNSNNANSNTKNDANSNTSNDVNSNTSNDANSNTSNDSNSNTKNNTNSNTKNDANSNTSNDANSNTSNQDNSNPAQEANSKPNNEVGSVDFQGEFKGTFSKVYAFGDSDTDTGNANFLGGLKWNISLPTIRGPRSGCYIIDFICDALNIPILSPYKDPSADFKNGVNFAVAGSTAFSSDFFARKNVSSLIWKGIPTSYRTQIDWFNKYLTDAGCKGNNVNGKNDSCKADVGKALFWVGQMGVSDYVSALGSPFPLLDLGLTEISVRHVCDLLKTILENGAKYIVVQGLPPVGCLPVSTSSSLSSHIRDHMGCVASINKGIMTHNQILQTKLEKLRKQYPTCKILYADFWNAFLSIVMNPKKFHFEEPFKACCGFNGGPFNFNKNSLCGSKAASICKDPMKYINWDGIHLTAEMYKHLAKLFLSQGFCHPNFANLLKAKMIL